MIRVENHGCTDSENTSTTESNSNISGYLTDDGLEGYLEYYKRRGEYKEEAYLSKVLNAIKLGKNNIYDKINAFAVACDHHQATNSTTMNVIKELLKTDEVLEAIRYDFGDDNYDDTNIESAEDLEKIDKAQKTIWGICGTYADPELVSLLLESGINLKKYGGDALRNAASNGKTEIVQKLLDYGVPIDDYPKNNTTGSTALTWSCIHGHKDVVSLLLKNGADIHVNNDYPIHMASHHDKLEIVKLLLETGANVNNSQALYWASFHGNVDIVKLLLENGADVDVDPDPLFAACLHNRTEVIKLLIKNGADVHKNNNKALLNTSYNKNVENVKLLLEAGAVVDDKVIKAAYGNNPEIMKELIGHLIFKKSQLSPFEIFDKVNDRKDKMKILKTLLKDPEMEKEFMYQDPEIIRKYYEWLSENYPKEYEKEYNDAIEKNMKLHEDNVLEWNRMILEKIFSNNDNILEENKENLMSEFRLRLMKQYDIVSLKNGISNEDVMEMYRYEAAGVDW